VCAVLCVLRMCVCVCVCVLFVRLCVLRVCLCLAVMKTLVSTALRVPVWSNISQEIQLHLFQRTLTDTCTGVPYAIDTCNLHKTVGCSLE